MSRTYLYIHEVARECRASVSTVRHWIAVGRLRGVRPGRRLLVLREDSDSFIEASTRIPRTDSGRISKAPANPRQAPFAVGAAG
jgi:excisionase family DNA binding protein